MLCSFMKEEWDYLVREVAPSDLPISDSVWRKLPHRIVEKVIAVIFFPSQLLLVCSFVGLLLFIGPKG